MNIILISGDSDAGWTVRFGNELSLAYEDEEGLSDAEVFDLLGTVDIRAMPKVYLHNDPAPMDLDDVIDFFGPDQY